MQSSFDGLRRSDFFALTRDLSYMACCAQAVLDAAPPPPQVGPIRVNERFGPPSRRSAASSQPRVYARPAASQARHSNRSANSKRVWPGSLGLAGIYRAGSHPHSDAGSVTVAAYRLTPALRREPERRGRSRSCVTSFLNAFSPLGTLTRKSGVGRALTHTSPANTDRSAVSNVNR